ncbi:(d)CMP kinase [Propionibacterium freudenreichii]|uniref:(d)CMP kinase n=1 Tax=Propionibacterium freudenreichii TaxID=1744 RepID=UPI000BC3389D|nr:(d)CMP kinase [Propionibacterium freudenreichii]MDK9295226.1 (d)CMP kinase [Propionibacterium freudenreichii]MDK9301921.1 (d)CMP kinase [Propionibacterium freudenreichii]MDK9321862.1 (d)CMP kinase [Propionibacterium freudenreichii]MDK9324869.1 (d)CMP kinase [Propionibacterium freudenreichii]MDK9339576.1 (d)CMP kinase [Propionibacterium freudenreichii]
MADKPALVIAIDGPSGAGKSSTARGVACRLSMAYLDTGAMYRAISWACLTDGVDPTSHSALFARAETADLQMGLDPRHPTIIVDGHDVTREIRDPRISEAVSAVATTPEIRTLLTSHMRQIINRNPRIVAEGRDVTTQVWPQARVRVLLVADAETRIARREAQLLGKVDRHRVSSSIVDRDRKDSTMSEFDKPAPGVTLIDSTYLDLGQVIDQVVGLVPTELR